MVRLAILALALFAALMVALMFMAQRNRQICSNPQINQNCVPAQQPELPIANPRKPLLPPPS